MNKKVKIRAFFERHIYAVCIFSVLIFVLLAGLFYRFTDYFLDVPHYNIPWLKYFDSHHLCEMYDKSLPGDAGHVKRYINYPPLFPAWLWMIRIPFEKAVNAGHDMTAYVLIKSMGLCSHVLILWYCCRKKKNREIFFWACNPAWLVITALWGQLDELFCFILVRFVESLQENRGVRAGLLFALMCVTKIQGIIMVIPYAVWLLTSKDRSRWKGVLAGLILGYTVWLPFTVHMRDPLFPVREYWFFGTDHMGNALPAPGIWWLALMLGFTDTSWMMTCQYLIWGFIIVIFVLDYMKRKDIWESVSGFWILLCPFSMGMLERYLTYPAACSLMGGRRRRGWMLTGLCTILCMEQAVVGMIWSSGYEFSKKISICISCVVYLAACAILITLAFFWINKRFSKNLQETVCKRDV